MKGSIYQNFGDWYRKSIPKVPRLVTELQNIVVEPQNQIQHIPKLQNQYKLGPLAVLSPVLADMAPLTRSPSDVALTWRFRSNLIWKNIKIVGPTYISNKK